MIKKFQHTDFSRIASSIVFGVALFAIIKMMFFDSLFDKTSFAMGLVLIFLFGFLAVIIIYILLDVWLERIIISNNRIIYKGVFGMKEIQNSKIKGFLKDGQHTSIYSKDNSIILSFDNRLKSDEKITDYLKGRFKNLEEEEEI